MRLKIFGDTQAIDWLALGVRMPFAPMHELAQKYKDALLPPSMEPEEETNEEIEFNTNDLCRTFELSDTCYALRTDVPERICYRIANTVAALEHCTSDTICINLGGGFHHAGKYPNSGYAYSLMNDHIWAVDNQLEKGIRAIQIYDYDFHFGGGTARYYQGNSRVSYSSRYHKDGLLFQHKDLDPYQQKIRLAFPQKILFNIGTDLLTTDEKFGHLNKLSMADYFDMVTEQIKSMTKGIGGFHEPSGLAITFGGSYGEAGLQFYELLIEWLKAL